MPGWKRSLWIALVITGISFLPLLIAWLFTLHGMDGLLTVNGVIRLIVIILACLGAAIIILSALDIYLASRRAPEKVGVPASYIWILTSLLTAIPLCLAGWIAPSQMSRSGDKAVQLFMADGVGRYGIPDLAVTFWTRELTANILKWGAGPDLDNIIKEDRPSQQHAFLDITVNNDVIDLIFRDPDYNELKSFKVGR